MKSKLGKVLSKFLILAPLLLVISCNANMNTNNKNKALNEFKSKEIIKNSLQIELDLKKELEINTNTPPILEIEKIEPGKQEIFLKSEFDNENLMLLEETEMANSEEEIAKIQEKLLLIGASEEITEQELGSSMKNPLNPTIIEFRVSRTNDKQEILNPAEEEINTEIDANTKDKIFDQKGKNNTLTQNIKTPTQDQFQKYETYLNKNGNSITKEYANQVRESLDKALNAIKNLEKSTTDLEIESLLKDQENSESTTTSNLTNHISTDNMEKTKNRLLEELKKSELVFEDTKDPLGTSTIKQVMDAANKWQEKENYNQINWNLGSKFHPKPKLYNKSVAQEYKVLAEKFTKVKNEYKYTKEQLKVQSKSTINNIRKIIDATKEFANQVKNLIVLVENNHRQTHKQAHTK
ncbi:lipoprotein (plasmid) [Borreliella chilensis]|uniref:Lipoprotein n=1 Tax=Borreliella chilensis TaxID=1245910 RepID=A0A0A7UWU2_9SPIR|nr:lipoprotein [Borreliella chilensis]